MIVFYIIALLLLIIPFPKIALKTNEYNNEYLKPENTLPVKGFFVLLVFFRHISQYISFDNTLIDKLFLFWDEISGQLIVSMFLFYSGYGIYESVRKKGRRYIDEFPKKRLLRTWLRFAVYVLMFLIFDIATNREYSLTQILLSFVGWESIGNSNWYMFVTFSLYILLFVVFRLTEHIDSGKALIMFSAATVILVILLYFLKSDSWWYNTILCFTAGMWYSNQRKNIELFIQKTSIRYWLSLIMTIALFEISFLIYYNIFPEMQIIESIIFTFLVTMLTMKINIRSKILSFFGKHLFSIYMLQRLSFLSLYGLIENKYLFFIICFVISIVLAVAADMFFDVFEKHIFGTGKKKDLRDKLS